MVHVQAVRRQLGMAAEGGTRRHVNRCPGGSAETCYGRLPSIRTGFEIS